MEITIEQFERAWSKRCINVFGIGSEDLPDVLCIDDFWYEGMTREELKGALDEMELSMRQELHFDVWTACGAFGAAPWGTKYLMMTLRQMLLPSLEPSFGSSIWSLAFSSLQASSNIGMIESISKRFLHHLFL